MNLVEYLDREIASSLEPGETVHARAYGRRPLRFSIAGVPQDYQPWLLVATDRRLIAFRTETSMMGAPQPRRLGTEIWRYDELESAHVADVAGIMTGGARSITLVPIPGFGAREGSNGRFDLPATQAELPDQARFSALADWLAQQVAARAFPMRPELRAEIDRRAAQHGQDAAAQQAAAGLRAQQNAEIGASVGRWAPPVLSVGCGVPLLLLALAGCAFTGLNALDGEFVGLLPILCSLISFALGVAGVVGGGVLISRARSAK